MLGRWEVVGRAAVVCLALTACGNRPVTVTIENEGPEAIKSVEVVYEHGRARCGAIPAGGSCKVRFPTEGETSYYLVVVFADGTTVKGAENYAERGYAFRDRVHDRKITNELRTLPAY